MRPVIVNNTFYSMCKVCWQGHNHMENMILHNLWTNQAPIYREEELASTKESVSLIKNALEQVRSSQHKDVNISITQYLLKIKLS